MAQKECIIDNVFDRHNVGCELECIKGRDCNYYQEPRNKEVNQTCQCDSCIKGTIHKSDCAVHNEPAERNEKCDCC